MTTEEGPWASGTAGTPDWSGATRYLSGRDTVLRALIGRIGPCTLVPRPNVFGTLVGAIVAQQISAAAARTIHKRLWALTRGRPPEPREILKRREGTLRGVGLSRQKIAYLRDLAARVESGALDLRALETMEDDAVRAALRDLYGLPGDAPAAEYERISDGWRPFRSIGVWYMYEHIHVLRAERREAAGA